MKFVENIIIILKGIVVSILSKKKTTIPNEVQSNKDNNNIINADNKQSVYRESVINNDVSENKELPSLNTKESIVTENLSQANIKTEPIIKFFRKANNDGIFLRISDKQEVQSWFKVVFKDETLAEGEYFVIEDKILNGILPNDYKSSIHIDDTLYVNDDTLKACKTLQKGFVKRKTEQEWQIKQILKIQIQ